MKHSVKTTIVVTLILAVIAVVVALLLFRSSDNTDYAEDTTNGMILDEIESLLPWENSGKKPADYTWEEYLALSNSEKEMFYESFENSEEFDEWATKAQNDALPWNSGEKKPADYTWEEYLALSNSDKELFFESFENTEDFDAWLDANQPG